MLIVNASQLKRGDEIIIPSNGSFRYYKLLDEPRLNPKTERISRIKCSTKMDIVQIPGWRIGKFRTVKNFIPVEPDQHNHIMSVDFRYRKMWLIRRIEF